MGLNIGRLLYGIRTKYEMNVKDICRGICSPSSYCMYENGEIVPDILLVNMFLDRMGFGILGLTAYISEKEVVYFKWKDSDSSDCGGHPAFGSAEKSGMLQCETGLRNL